MSFNSYAHCYCFKSRKIIAVLKLLEKELYKKSKEFSKIVKVEELIWDNTPLTLGQNSQVIILNLRNVL